MACAVMLCVCARVFVCRCYVFVCLVCDVWCDVVRFDVCVLFVFVFVCLLMCVCGVFAVYCTMLAELCLSVFCVSVVCVVCCVCICGLLC